MSLLDRHWPRAAAVALIAACPAWPGSVAMAQTIGDYSRAQRTLIETTMTQAAARSAALAASASAPGAAASASTAAAAVVSRRYAPPEVLEPVVRIGGIFASSSRAVAEVAIDGSPYLLTTGQGVPGTPWHVEAIASDHVVLARAAADGKPGTDGVRKTFALPSLR